MTTLPYPDYVYDPHTHTGELTEPFYWVCKIEGVSVDTSYAFMESDGTLVIKTGYVWDFGSGPAIDTPNMVVASLVHDVGCDLTAEGVVDWSYRKDFDREFRRVLKLYGSSRLRRTYAYAAVRINSLLVSP